MIAPEDKLGVIAWYQEGSTLLGEAVRNLTDADLDAIPAGGGWTVRQTWGDRWAYSRRSLGASLSLLKAIRTHILQLLESVPDAWDRAAIVRKPDGEVERVPVGFVIQMQADHVLHHISRIHEILQERNGA